MTLGGGGREGGKKSDAERGDRKLAMLTVWASFNNVRGKDASFAGFRFRDGHAPDSDPVHLRACMLASETDGFPLPTGAILF